MGNILSPSPGFAPAHGGPEDLRHQANNLFEQRNQAFQRSQDCYHRGDHAGAKRYSNQGKQLDARAKALSKQAADMTYQQRNAGRPVDEVDLHGLTVKEAIAKVEAALKHAKELKQDHVVFIVGKGLHSGAEGPKLKPAITALIDKHNLRCTVGRPNEGCLYVEFVSARERGWFGELLANTGCIIC